MKNSRIKNKKGFTLVEIIVSLAIFSAVLAVLGGIMVSGFNYFYETSSTDLNKRSVDELLDYVRGELLYATDVRVQDEKPNEDNWYSFSIIDGQLHQFIEHKDKESEDLNIFSNKAFYNNNSLKMTAKAYENSSRLDLKYILYDDKEELYTTRDTLELLNVKSVQTDAFADELVVGENELKIYYKKGKAINKDNESGSTDVPSENVSTGTVADQIEWLNIFNVRYYENVYSETQFSRGDFIFYEGYWWRYIHNSTYQTHLADYYIKNGFLKKIDSNFAPNSYYEKGDVVFYPKTNKYYKYKGDSVHASWSEGPSPNDGWGTEYWEDIGEQPPKEMNLACGDIAYSKNKEKTIAKKLLNVNLNEILEFDSSKTYNANPNVVNYKPEHFVKIFDKNTKQYKYYLKLFDSKTNMAPNETRKIIQNGKEVELVDWQLICVDALSNNAYIGNDQGWYNENSCFRLLNKDENNGLGWGTNGIGKHDVVINLKSDNTKHDYYISGALGFWKQKNGY